MSIVGIASVAIKLEDRRSECISVTIAGWPGAIYLHGSAESMLAFAAQITEQANQIIAERKPAPAVEPVPPIPDYVEVDEREFLC